MGIAEEEVQDVWKILMERILSERPSAKCPFSCIIMEKGGYWVGVLLCCGFVLSLSLSFSITFFSLSLSL